MYCKCGCECGYGCGGNGAMTRRVCECGCGYEWGYRCKCGGGLQCGDPYDTVSICVREYEWLCV